jgi:histidyl-tRNA synthetase
MAVLNYIFKTMRTAVQRFGYQEYTASILEPTELYAAKSGSEIVNEQTYSFIDRGNRGVTLRPEMTPTVARMVAGRKHDLVFPLRWFSIPNLFRYEQPQRGRLREHFQLNVDLFGIDGIDAEVEIGQVMHAIMKGFGAKNSDYIIRINNRKTSTFVYQTLFGLSASAAVEAIRLVDRKNKMSAEAFKAAAMALFETEEQTEFFLALLNTQSIAEFTAHIAKRHTGEIPGIQDITTLIDRLGKLSIDNIVFDPTLARGFDYYTGIVFEVYDTNPENSRALFGGGRFDELLALFGNDQVAAVGFGMGDVRIRDFLETHNLLPEKTSTTSLAIFPFPSAVEYAEQLATELRDLGLNVVVNISQKKIGNQIAHADKAGIPFVLVLGDDEIAKHSYTIKQLSNGAESPASSAQDIVTIISSR